MQIYVEVYPDEFSLTFHIHEWDAPVFVSAVCIVCQAESEYLKLSIAEQAQSDRNARSEKIPCVCKACQETLGNDYFCTYNDIQINNATLQKIQAQENKQPNLSEEGLLAAVIQQSTDAMSAHIHTRICALYETSLPERYAMYRDIFVEQSPTKTFNKLYDKLIAAKKVGTGMVGELLYFVQTFATNAANKAHQHKLLNPYHEQPLWSEAAQERYNEIKKSLQSVRKKHFTPCSFPILIEKLEINLVVHSDDAYGTTSEVILGFQPIIIEKVVAPKNSPFLVKSQKIFSEIPGLRDLKKRQKKMFS